MLSDTLRCVGKENVRISGHYGIAMTLLLVTNERLIDVHHEKRRASGPRGKCLYGSQKTPADDCAR
jgi:hypothetical protein